MVEKHHRIINFDHAQHPIREGQDDGGGETAAGAGIKLDQPPVHVVNEVEDGLDALGELPLADPCPGQ